MPRETAIQVRVSFEEKERIEARAKEVGIKPSEFIREVALGFADYKDLEDSGGIPENLQAAAEDIGALAVGKKAPEKPASYQSARTKTAARDAERDSWIASTARILMMEKKLSKVAATMQATKEWEAESE